MRFLAGLALGATPVTAALPLISLLPASTKSNVCPESWAAIQCDYDKDGYKDGWRGGLEWMAR